MRVGPSVPAIASVVEDSKSTSSEKIQLVVSSNTFVLCWVGVHILHFASVAFLVFLGGVHLVISTDVVYRAVWLLRIEQSTLRLAGWTYLALAAVHVYELACDARQSIRFGRMTFAANTTSDNKSGPVTTCNNNEATSSTVLGRLRSLKTAIQARYRIIKRSIGVSGEHFHLLMRVRHAVEVASQIYQTHMFSWAVPRYSVIRTLLVLLLVNCTYMPVVRMMFKQKPGPRLAAVLAVDLVLDIACSTIVPLLIIVPRFIDFDWTRYTYPDELRFNEEWFVMALSEVRQVLSTSPVDHLTTIVPYVAVIDSLHTLKAVLMRVIEAPPQLPTPSHSIGPSVVNLPRSMSKATQLGSVISTGSARRHKQVLFRTFDKFMVAIAVGILSVHLHAEFRPANSSITSCKLLLKPWFAHNMSCAIFDYNCYREDSSGLEDQVLLHLNRMDRASVMKLRFSHCSSLSMPPAISQFPKLLGIQTFNSTIASWSSAAAITETSHSKMAEVQLFSTNMTTLPDGLVHGDLPIRLSLILHRSNLTHLPEDVGDKWRGHLWPYLSLQRTPLQRLPSSFHRARAYYLSLMDTHLESIGDDVLADFSLYALRLSHNRLLSRLPANIGSDAELHEFEAEYTNVSRLTPWLDGWLSTKVPAIVAARESIVFSLHGSPYCDGLDAATEAKSCAPHSMIALEDYRHDIVQAQSPL